MAKQRRANQKELPKNSTISYNTNQIEACWEDTLDPSGRFSPLPEYARYDVVMYVLRRGDNKK